MISNISAVILAGGANKRFKGTTKSNIIINGETIISRIVNTLKIIFNEIILVTNTPEEFKEYNYLKIVSDQILKVGPLGGIHAAFKVASTEALFVFAGDMPLLDSKLIMRQIGSYNLSACDILVPRINKYIEPLHAIYNISVIEILEKYLSGNNDYAVREFFKMVNVRYMDFEESEESRNAFTNINSPSDIPHVEKIIADFFQGESLEGSSDIN